MVGYEDVPPVSLGLCCTLVVYRSQGIVFMSMKTDIHSGALIVSLVDFPLAQNNVSEQSEGATAL
jgi:hypothetical protein